MHCGKSVRIRSYSGLYFPTFGLNTERYSVSLHIQSKCGKMRTRITLNTDTFHAVIVCVIIRSIAITIIINIVNHMKTCTYVLHSKIYHEPTATCKIINLFRDEIASTYFNQKVINNVQSRYRTNIMELTLAIFNDCFNLKIKRDSFSDRW